MKQLKAILVDDEADGIAALKSMIQSNCPEITIVATCNNAAMAQRQIATHNPDLVFLDIQMPGQSGIEMLHALPDKTFETIFVTAHNEYLLQALHLSAVDYLLKPVDEDKLAEAVKRVLEKRQEKTEPVNLEVLLHNLQAVSRTDEMKLCVPTLKGFVVIKLEEIILCEAERNYTIFHLGNKKNITVSRPLIEYENILEQSAFLRVHKTFLINLHHVTEYYRGEGGTVLMSNGMEVDISRRKKDEFLSRIKQIYRY